MYSFQNRSFWLFQVMLRFSVWWLYAAAGTSSGIAS
jgi:hypothetical protein